MQTAPNDTHTHTCTQAYAHTHFHVRKKSSLCLQWEWYHNKGLANQPSNSAETFLTWLKILCECGSNSWDFSHTVGIRFAEKQNSCTVSLFLFCFVISKLVSLFRICPHTRLHEAELHTEELTQTLHLFVVISAQITVHINSARC